LVLPGVRKPLIAASAVILLVLLGLAAAAGQSGQPSQSQSASQKQDVPDAPSTVQPPPPAFPSAPPVETPRPPASNTRPNNESAPANQAPPSSSSGSTAASPSAAPKATSNSETEQEPPGAPPPLKITTVPQGGATGGQTGTQEQVYKLSVNVNQVFVPVRVTDDSGHLIAGLLPTDFSVYEDGKKQTMNFFTSDPFALSAAVVIDFGMPDVALQKVNRTFSTLEAAFSQYDEVALYTYSNTVSQLADFGNASRKLTAALNELKTKRGENNGVPITGGPLSNTQGPMINDIPVNPTAPAVVTPERTAHVLNDAILAAAKDLVTRDKARRKIIFVISDGREYRSDAAYGDVLRVLLTNGIMVYGVSVESSAIPGYSKLEKLHLPKFGYSDILPKYANATGGEILAEYSKNAIENVYQQVIGAARNEYTLGYNTRATPSTTYREIEVRVDRPSCKTDLRPCVDVYAKAGYYPLPPGK
jgi:VWFA-related protein